jgi:hypothetical protein
MCLEACLEAASGDRIGDALALTPWKRVRAVCLGADRAAGAFPDRHESISAPKIIELN